MKFLQAILNLKKISAYVFGVFIVTHKLIVVIKFLEAEHLDSKLVKSLVKVSASLETVLKALRLVLKLFGQDTSTYTLSASTDLDISLDDLEFACIDLEEVLNN